MICLDRYDLIYVFSLYRRVTQLGVFKLYIRSLNVNWKFSPVYEKFLSRKLSSTPLYVNSFSFPGVQRTRMYADPGYQLPSKWTKCVLIKLNYTYLSWEYVVMQSTGWRSLYHTTLTKLSLFAARVRLRLSAWHAPSIHDRVNTTAVRMRGTRV